jgi:hypothetical protein
MPRRLDPVKSDELRTGRKILNALLYYCLARLSIVDLHRRKPYIAYKAKPVLTAGGQRA